MAQSYRVKILGKYWQLKLVPNPGNDCDGICDPPTAINKSILVRQGLDDENLARVTIHECLHASSWPLDEGYIDQASEDIARILIKLGYFRKKD